MNKSCVRKLCFSFHIDVVKGGYSIALFKRIIEFLHAQLDLCMNCHVSVQILQLQQSSKIFIQ